LIFQPGVQLSFGVLLAIGLFTAAATRLFAWLSRREPYLPLPLYGWWRTRWLKLRESVATALGASTAASLGSLPLTGWHFGFFSSVSILASPLIGLPVFLLMALALLGAALSPLPALREKVNRLNGRVAATCTRIATRAAAIPGGSVNFPRDRPAEHFLIVYDVRHGGGAACLHDAGSSLLVDTGHRPGFRRTLLPSLRHLALRPRSLALSHPDGGHLGGAVEALDALPVRQILLPVERARSQSFRALQEAAGSRGVATTRGQAGRTYRISPDAWIEVLHEPDPLDFHAVADQRVMVVRLHWQGWRILFLSDAGWRTERAMLESGRDLGADVIVAGRHRNDSTMGDPFLAAVNPRAIVAGHADFPPEERVPAAWQAACENAGIRVFHQGRTGGVTLVPGEDGTLVVRGFLDGAELVLRK
jgi:competence protein ComEC